MEKVEGKEFNHPYEKTKTLPHDIIPIVDVKDLRLEKIGKSDLTKLSFDIDNNVKFGYFFSKGQEFDLTISNKIASVTIHKDYFDADSATIALFK